MPDFRKITDTFYVAPQISVEDIASATNDGFSVLIMNRPDGETPDQPMLEDLVSSAETNGMSFFHIPIIAPPNLPEIDATLSAIQDNDGKKVLAFCRSGTRSATLWAYAMARSKSMPIDEIISKARNAGYDLAPHAPRLEAVAAM
ncbi:TIGR01244 family sulfur transferase [Ponticaulis sp.]|uniref:TIGR01244 family sulfur transferase n=1 Tax=Ponticaulis sp. TaxID=2020902 RepID=UPI0025DD7D30|nr:TIGR01244 family sulfur transferase [Ponticaulis sp.]